MNSCTGLMFYLHELKDVPLGACVEAAAAGAPPKTDPPWGAFEPPPNDPKPPPELALWATEPKVAPAVGKR